MFATEFDRRYWSNRLRVNSDVNFTLLSQALEESLSQEGFPLPAEIILGLMVEHLQRADQDKHVRIVDQQSLIPIIAVYQHVTSWWDVVSHRAGLPPMDSEAGSVWVHGKMYRTLGILHGLTRLLLSLVEGEQPAVRKQTPPLSSSRVESISSRRPQAIGSGLAEEPE